MLEPTVASDAEHTLPLTKRQRLVVGVVLVVALALFAYLLREATNPHSTVRVVLATLIDRVRDPSWGLLYVLLAFGLGTLAFAPVTLLLGATALVLPPALGFAYGMLGGLFGCTVSYWIGRALGGSVVVRYGGKRLIQLRTHVHARSFRSVLIARFLPIGNFTLINLFLGSLKVPYVPYLAANFVGITPSLLALTLLSDQLHEAIEKPSVASIGRLAVVAVALLVAVFGLSRVLGKRTVEAP